jgi:hypothetical protein
MGVPSNLSDCVCFLCTRDGDKHRPRATAFFVSVPAVEGSYVYLVTAKHSVERAKRHGTLFVRLNTKAGMFLTQEISTNWVYNDDSPGSDVAVLPFEVPNEVQLAAIPIEMLATDEIVLEKGIGVGDQVVVTGLFTKRSGVSRNIPIMRTGSIASMPEEIILGRYAEEYLAYLIELRSTGGLSGSPVFVVKEWFVDPKNKTPNLGLQRFSSLFYLIGIIRGHWDQQNNAEDIADDGQQEAEPFNLGIAVATPIQECLKILNGNKLLQERSESDFKWAKKLARKRENLEGND